MSRMDEQHTTYEAASSAPAVSLSAGQWLRQARERAGMDLGVLSALVKVPVRQLQALEADQHDQLMGTAFVRSLTVTICRHVGVDPQPALDLLPGNITRLGPEKDSLGEADGPQLGGLFHGRTFAWGKWAALVLALVLAGGTYSLWHQSSTDESEVADVLPPAVMPAPAAAEPTTVTTTDAAAAQTPANAQAPAVPPSTVTLPAVPAAVPAESKSQQ